MVDEGEAGQSGAAGTGDGLGTSREIDTAAATVPVQVNGIRSIWRKLTDRQRSSLLRVPVIDCKWSAGA